MVIGLDLVSYNSRYMDKIGEKYCIWLGIEMQQRSFFITEQR